MAGLDVRTYTNSIIIHCTHLLVVIYTHTPLTLISIFGGSSDLGIAGEVQNTIVSPLELALDLVLTG